jgi:hypothetical protein
MTKYRSTALFLIVVPLAFNFAFFALGGAFEYPDILRQPTADILQKFSAGGSSLVVLWYVFALTALLSDPLALLLQSVFEDEHPQLARAAGVIGVLAGLVQTLGLFRWVFLVPTLAATVADPAATPGLRDAAMIAFESAHQYLGVAVGEHLGYFFTGTWTILLSVMMFRSRWFNRGLGIVGISAAIGIMVGLLEPAGVEFAGLVNALSYIVWSVWLVTAGLLLFRRSAS